MELFDMPGHILRRLHQHSAQTFQSRINDAGHDVTPVQFAVMDAVRENPGIDQAGVAALVAYDRATIGGVIERLEQKGYLRRDVSKRDRRAREVSLTEKGSQAYRDIIPVVRDIQSHILPGLTPDEKEQFINLARKVAASVDPEVDLLK